MKNSRELLKQYKSSSRDTFQGILARLFEELHDERAGIWGTTHPHEMVLAKAISQHTKYREVNEYLLANKINISNIVWLGIIPSRGADISQISSIDIGIVDKYLIAHFKPTANRQKFIGYDLKPEYFKHLDILIREVSKKLNKQVSSLIALDNVDIQK